MKTFFKLLLVPAMLIAFSCEQETVTDPTPEDLTAITGKGKKHPVPIANALESDPLDPSDVPDLPCLTGDILPFAAGGGAYFYGTITHMGRVSGTTKNLTCSTTLTENGVDLAITSRDTIETASGDLVYTNGSIVVHIVNGESIATITGGSIIDGGTGRFENATGEFVYHDMIIDLVTGHESHTSTGWITY